MWEGSVVKFHGYECPQCGAWHSEISGFRTHNGTTEIRCPACLSVDRFETYQEGAV